MLVETNQTYVLLKPMRVRRNGELIMLKIGQEIPEAFGWDNADYWCARGFIRLLNRPVSPDVRQFIPKKISTAELMLEQQAEQLKEKAEKKAKDKVNKE